MGISREEEKAQTASKKIIDIEKKNTRFSKRTVKLL